VPNARLACRRHWYELPAELRDRVYRTASLSTLHPVRREVLEAVKQAWEAAP
jgi:hypothetical protein